MFNGAFSASLTSEVIGIAWLWLRNGWGMWDGYPAGLRICVHIVQFISESK